MPDGLDHPATQSGLHVHLLVRTAGPSRSGCQRPGTSRDALDAVEGRSEPGLADGVGATAALSWTAGAGGPDPKTGPVGEADVTTAPVDEGSGADLAGATLCDRKGTVGASGSPSAGTVVVCSGSTGRNSVRSSRRTSGAGSTTRTSTRPASCSSAAGAARTTA